MNGDRHKPMNSFIRWLEYTTDGVYAMKEGEKVPAGAGRKRYNRRWLRRQGRRAIQEG